MKLTEYLDHIVKMLETIVFNTMPKRFHEKLLKKVERQMPKKRGRPKGAKNKSPRPIRRPNE